MGPDLRGVSSWEDGFLVVVVSVFFILSGAGLWLAWLNRRKD
jgi:peptidoglycan/LPS O-acetylase OafA/YrhL